MQTLEYHILSLLVQRTDRRSQIGMHGESLLTANWEVCWTNDSHCVLLTLTREGDDGVYVDGLDRLSVRCDEC
jgi:hypothetical protein